MTEVNQEIAATEQSLLQMMNELAVNDDNKDIINAAKNLIGGTDHAKG